VPVGLGGHEANVINPIGGRLQPDNLDVRVAQLVLNTFLSRHVVLARGQVSEDVRINLSHVHQCSLLHLVLVFVFRKYVVQRELTLDDLLLEVGREEYRD